MDWIESMRAQARIGEEQQLAQALCLVLESSHEPPVVTAELWHNARHTNDFNVVIRCSATAELPRSLSPLGRQVMEVMREAGLCWCDVWRQEEGSQEQAR